MCAFEGKATTHSQFLASDKFRVALRERTYLGHRQSSRFVSCVAPFFVLTVGTSVGALMPMRMLRPSLVFVCVGDVLFSLFRATGEFMFAGRRRSRFCRRKPLRFRLRRPVNGGKSSLARASNESPQSSIRRQHPTIRCICARLRKLPLHSL